MTGIDPDIPRHLQGVERPFWQTGPCPKWCYGDHADSDFVDDRFHFGGTVGTTLTLEAPYPVGDGEVVPHRLDADLYQGYRETEPHVTFGLRNGFGVRITVREAVEIAHMLIHVTDVATGEADISEETQR